MNPDILEFAREWLQLAGEDLKWAKASFREGFYSQTCFVCQQVAEKSLKGYLYAFRRDAKTHDLIRLMELCLEFDSAFLSLKKDLRILEPYYRVIYIN
ncbi:hypothetical protein A2627_01925 [Candidatus Woesebacteria bacterium RIFCSPHIGHO2_01_FULL_39_28]|uniref:HEPN domain-containing protein n=1 Tax=Candidatus Woesebacteria bacterium RIFCSPHIGHO2_01_FULL_39_28 TaxID=1802496 RepID=A0A1F7YIQ7_9BACT|nr:MAG: hypothetical protein A2627_01925 [Candidatus Woesebacteria bacterium RIFCSPHIGHO2_01_FULL_39_28]OGM57032.1 MAG: hypothetical protein A3A50_03550 [Candidatus Woesebacteria bacterium RIFCSPLOWO2_01_FULL_38_20]